MLAASIAVHEYSKDPTPANLRQLRRAVRGFNKINHWAGVRLKVVLEGYMAPRIEVRSQTQQESAGAPDASE